MSNTYIIQWKSLANGRAGKGTKLFSREEAEELAEELNREFPQISHRAIRSNGAAEQESSESPVEPVHELSFR